MSRFGKSKMIFKIFFKQYLLILEMVQVILLLVSIALADMDRRCSHCGIDLSPFYANPYYVGGGYQVKPPKGSYGKPPKGSYGSPPKGSYGTPIKGEKDNICFYIIIYHLFNYPPKVKRTRVFSSTCLRATIRDPAGQGSMAHRPMASDRGPTILRRRTDCLPLRTEFRPELDRPTELH